jgi:hypothetical protein
MSESPYPDGTPEFVTEAVEDAFLRSEQVMGDPKWDASYARGYYKACVDFRETLKSIASEDEHKREQRRLQAVANLQKEKNGQPS